MKIRSVTAFSHLGPPINMSGLQELGEITSSIQKRLEAEGFEVQSTRLASNPFSELIDGLNDEQAIEMAGKIENAALEAGFGFISLGPMLADKAEKFELIANIFSKTKLTFVSASLTSSGNQIYPEAIKKAAQAIRDISVLEANGFANLRFAALANVPAGSPFFPAAYHDDLENSFAFATQAADMAISSFKEAKNINEGIAQLSMEIEQQGQKLGKIGQALSQEHGIGFGGIDFSLAPFPEDQHSLGKAMEDMGVPMVGMNGSLTAAALLTGAIQAADFPQTGFNGLLLPPLEDSVLAKRAAEGLLTVNDLLLYSAVCGTGLDTVPLPGDVPVETLEAILMDVAALALRLDKPLTARLMPIPGKTVGDETDFDFDFFANSRIMAANGAGLGGALNENQAFTILKRS